MKNNKEIKLTRLQRLGLELEIYNAMEKYPEFKKRVLEVAEQARLRNDSEKNKG